MMIYNTSGVTCQLGNFCFECVTQYTLFSALKYSKTKIYRSYCWQWNGNGREWE